MMTKEFAKLEDTRSQLIDYEIHIQTVHSVVHGECLKLDNAIRQKNFGPILTELKYSEQQRKDYLTKHHRSLTCFQEGLTYLKKLADRITTHLTERSLNTDHTAQTDSNNLNAQTSNSIPARALEELPKTYRDLKKWNALNNEHQGKLTIFFQLIERIYQQQEHIATPKRPPKKRHCAGGFRHA